MRSRDSIESDATLTDENVIDGENVKLREVGGIAQSRVVVW